MKAMKAALSMAVAVGFLFAAQPGVQAETAEDSAKEKFRAQVIDLSCLVVHDLSGEDHRHCAQVCADQGVPLAFVDEEGTIFHPVSMEMPSSGDEINEKLRPHAERWVVVEGQLVERGGTNGIIIESVEAAD